MRDYNVLLLRKESFGGTLFSPQLGKRAYITHQEFSLLTKERIAPSDLTWASSTSAKLRVVDPRILPTANFSCADTVFFEVTRICNIRCTHCFNSSGYRLKDELTKEQCLDVIDDLAQAGVQEIRFTGGEPLALSFINRLLERAATYYLRISIGTNAMLIGQAVAKRLADIGLNRAIVSVDGLQEYHDAIRGPGSFQKTITGLKHLQAQNIPVRVNVVVTKNNLAGIERVVSYFIGQNVPVMLRRLILSGRSRADQKNLLTRNDYAELAASLKPYLDMSGNMLEGHYLKEFAFQPRIPLPFGGRPCDAGQRGIVILPNGAVQTCGFLGPLGEKPFGFLPQEKIKTVWQRIVGSNQDQILKSTVREHASCGAGGDTNCFAEILGRRLSETIAYDWE